MLNLKTSCLLFVNDLSNLYHLEIIYLDDMLQGFYLNYIDLSQANLDYF